MTDQRELGLLKQCGDKRFHAKVRTAFEKVSGLAADEYWEAVEAGGGAGDSRLIIENYAHSHGARTIGMAAHGDNCGGLPGLSNDAIKARLRNNIANRKQEWPGAKFFGIFATEANTESWED